MCVLWGRCVCGGGKGGWRGMTDGQERRIKRRPKNRTDVGRRTRGVEVNAPL